MGVLRNLRNVLPLPRSWKDEEQHFGMRVNDAITELFAAVDRVKTKDITVLATDLTEGAWADPVAHTSDATGSHASDGTLIPTTKDKITGIFMRSGDHVLVSQMYTDGTLWVYCVKKSGSGNAVVRITYR